jgi:hypothetical protein
MLNEKTVTLLKKIATTPSTRKNQAKLEKFLNKKAKQNTPEKAKGNKHILDTHHSTSKKPSNHKQTAG